MHKITAPGATPQNEFTDGNPSVGTPATRLVAAWLNTVQRELLAILAAAGITPSANDDDQVLEAIQALIAAAGGVPDATETIKGKAQVATQAEVNAGVNDSDFVTALKLITHLQGYPLLDGTRNFSGTVTAPAFNTNSSKRWKSDIEYINPDLARHMLSFVELFGYFNEKVDRRQLGTIAEKLHGTPMQFVVSYDDQGLPTGVDYQSLFAVAMVVVKDNDQRLGDLSQRVAALESR